MARVFRRVARYYDAQVTFAERLVLENLLAAKAAGADIATHCRVDRISLVGSRVDAIEWVDADGMRQRAAVKAVINAAGPWVDAVLGAASEAQPQLIGGTKGSHIVVPKFDGAPTDAFYVEAASDGRPIFIIPWNGLYLVGTTDIRYDGNLDTVRASRDEVDYLLAEVNRVFPAAALSSEDIVYAYAGVRPLPFRESGPESAITRRHIIHVNRQKAENLVSIIGGKLTTYRNLAEQAVDRLGKMLGTRLPKSRTAATLLPGAWGSDRASELLAEQGLLSAQGIDRLLSIYGGRAVGIAELMDSMPDLINADLAAAEVVFVVSEEFPHSLTDIVYRRMMLGFDADQGRAVWPDVAEIAARQLDWDSDRRDTELRELAAFADSLLVA